MSIGFADFFPSHLDVLVGDTVTWRNDSVRQHTVTANDESWDSGRLGARAVFRRRFDQAGTGWLLLPPARDPRQSRRAQRPARRVAQPRRAGPAARAERPGRLGAGTEVRIEADTGAGFVPEATVTAELGGRFHLDISPRVITRYRAVLGSEASPPITIVVLDRRVAVSFRPRGRRTMVSARVTPASPGVSAVLQLRLAHRFGWWPVARAHLDRSSRVRFAIPRGRPHRARVILTLADGATITAASRTFRVGRR